ncbi:uncharacterized protein BT62DRAFT_937542 [Guyanagaster necrorhizus]|uniref:Uncharacterized protein n=1 Tax=Guyanagaster necrorhizus TaxID=856835 RepID=A0A9P8AM62_9AGAR|nr:uncharacterized protein BT62DRAFT_937542 [Guyanagaster necrorhizus MCA 3950]KAG7440943.1 hypothetical protein BT62DRAFT_937542 [Guyanagaster necrorhizus MCA 3950]
MKLYGERLQAQMFKKVPVFRIPDLEEARRQRDLGIPTATVFLLDVGIWAIYLYLQ